MNQIKHPLYCTFSAIKRRSLWAVVGSLSTLLTATAVRSAETIQFDYGAFGRSLPVSSLETFVEEGVIDAELEPYAHLIPADRQAEFRNILGEPLATINSDLPEQLFSPFVLSQWLYSPIGERTLFALGRSLQTGARQNGQQALRAALILAAADPEGLTLMGMIKHFPGSSLRLDINQTLLLVREVQTSFEETNRFVEQFITLSEAAAATDPPMDYGALANLSQSGSYQVASQSLMLQDLDRPGVWGEGPRTFPVDLYWPADLNAIQGSLPVLVMSHGYGDTRTRFADAAQSIAANGFMVVLPEHVGSNSAYRDAMEAGLTQETFQAMEFVNRPLDIRFVLDELEQRNASQFQNRLQLDKVQMVGHSLGGYTALAVAGATVDFDRVAQRCAPAYNEVRTIDIAVLITCRVLELSDSPQVVSQLTDGSLRDSRVQAVMAMAPVSNLFGPSGMSQINIPVMLAGGAYDLAAPVVAEQLNTFQWIKASLNDKYFYMGERTSHTPGLTRMTNQLFHPGTGVTQSLDDAEQWQAAILRNLAIAFGRVYLLDQTEYRPYLTSSYVETVSEEPLKLHLLRYLPDDFQD
jgi:predicted dienelactone hydrolase